MSLNSLDAIKLRMHLTENENVADEWIGEVADLQQKLDAANQRIEKLEISNRDGQRLINELNWQLADAERAKEAAERQRATVLTALTDIRKYIDNFDGSWDIDHIYGLVMYALAQIEQPQESVLPGECPYCHCFPAREFHAVNCKTNDYLKKKQQEDKPRESLTETIEKLRAITRANPETQKRIEEYLARGEQPTQKLPGEDPPFDMCQCRTCVSLRTRTETKTP